MIRIAAHRTVGMLAAALILSCADDVPDPPAGGATTGDLEPVGVDCSPGAEVGCMCLDGRAGVQVCAPSGSELGACACGPAGADDTGSGSDTNGSDTSDPTGAAGLCGNGMLDDDEQCDDGNTRYDDACSNDCIAECGLVWERQVGDPDGGSTGQAIAIGPDNSIAVVGTTVTGTGSDIWVTRYDAEGTALWFKTFDTGDHDFGQGIAVDQDGNLLVVGTVDAAGDAAQSDIWIAMLDARGAELWSTIHDGVAQGNDLGSAAVFDPDGNPVVSGTVRAADGDSDLWIAKFDASGVQTWSTHYGGVGNGEFSLDSAGGLAVDGSGDLYAQVEVYVDFDERDVHLLKFAADGGAPLWDVAPFAGGTPDLHRAAGVRTDASGNVLLGINNNAIPTGWRFWVSLIDPNGNEVWQRDDAATGLGVGHALAGLGASTSGQIGLVLQRAAVDGNLQAVAATLHSDGSPACDSTVARDLGGIVPTAGTVAPSGHIVATGTVSENGTTQQPWIARFRGAAAAR